jgi:hypothetical protein
MSDKVSKIRNGEKLHAASFRVEGVEFIVAARTVRNLEKGAWWLHAGTFDAAKTKRVTINNAERKATK